MVYKKHCCYGLCTNDTRYPERLEMKDIFFINFPKPITQPEKCKRWIKLCGRPREQFNVKSISKDTFICSKHFVGENGPTLDHPDPIPATAFPEEIRKYILPKRKAPTIRLACTSPDVYKKKRLDAACALLSLSGPLSDENIYTDNQLNGLENLRPPVCKFTTVETQTDIPICQCQNTSEEKSTQTVYEKYMLQSKIDTIILKNKVTASISPQKNRVQKNAALLSIDDIKNDDRKVKFFTGLTFLHFMALFNFLGPAVNNLTYWNTKAKQHYTQKTKPIDELFLTLVRLRRGYCFYNLTFLFKLSESKIRSVFTTWLQLLYCHFNEIRSLMFPDRSVLKKFMPKSFKGFKNVRCSVDCTEFFVQMPKDFGRQGNLYSNYKHHHTFKCLLAVAPNGTCVFVSNLYEGAISDRDIFEQCGILNHLNPSDLLLVDRGFTVEDLLQQKQASMYIPAFLKGRERLTPQEELLTRKIAKARIHVERFNEGLKKFKLISGTIPLTLTPLASQAVFVACCLVNFQDQLAK